MPMLLIWARSSSANVSLAVDPATFPILGQEIGLLATGLVQEAINSGGWPAYAYPRKRKLAELRRELEEEQEREELAERLERTLVDDGSLTQVQADLIRLRGIAAQYSRDDLTNRARRALAFAERAQNDFSYQLAMREMRRLGEEEELAVLLLMALD